MLTARPTLMTVGPTARRLRVPANWLRAEALAGRVPHLRAGKSLLFDPDAVEAALLERARQLPPPPHGGAAP
jgi:hypothetical protein